MSFLCWCRGNFQALPFLKRATFVAGYPYDYIGDRQTALARVQARHFWSTSCNCWRSHTLSGPLSFCPWLSLIGSQLLSCRRSCIFPFSRLQLWTFSMKIPWMLLFIVFLLFLAHFAQKAIHRAHPIRIESVIVRQERNHFLQTARKLQSCSFSSTTS